MAAPEVYLARHAPTASNRAKIFMGHTDVPADPIADPESYRVAQDGPRTVLSSPSSRATTACEVLYPGEPVTTDVRLLERSVGEWSGLDHATVAARWPGSFKDGRVDPAYPPPGGEDLTQLRTRVAGFLHDLAGRTDETVCVVTHNGWIRTALWVVGELEEEHLFAEQTPFLTPFRFPIEQLS